MRVFITGATGLVGSHVAEQLRGRGDEVVALTRSTSDISHLQGLGVRTVNGELADPLERLAEAMEGCDAVVHAAAMIYSDATEAEYLRTNVQGTERVLRGAAAAGVLRAVHVSSIAVYGAVRRPVSEAEWLAHPIPPHNIYARSKREAELAAWRVHEAGLIGLTTVRPGVVLGERDRLVVPMLARALRWPVLPLPGGGRTTIPVIYAGNVAAAIIAALDRPDAAGRAYNLSGEPGLTARQLLTVMGAEIGRTPRLLRVHAKVVRGGAAVGDALRPLLAGVGLFGLKRAAWLATHDDPYDDTRAQRELDWDAVRVPTTEAMRRTAAWWRGTRDGT